MHDDPLTPPAADSDALDLFVRHFRIDRAAPPSALLEAIATAFARLPYENLTKIVKDDREGRAARSRRAPYEVVAEHAKLGTGGTCFSLTATLVHLLRALGWRAEPILADRRYGEDTHSALVVDIDGVPHLLDPGYLIVRPIPLVCGASEDACVRTAFNEVVLRSRDDGDRVELHTRQSGNSTYRLTFKTEPAAPDRFLAAWDASFDWDMMRYPLLTRVAGDRQLYLQDRRFQVRTCDAVERGDIARDELVSRIEAEFGIARHVVGAALDVLARRGEIDSGAPTP